MSYRCTSYNSNRAYRGVRWLGLEQLLGYALDVARLDPALVRLHDVADEAADLLGVGDAERAQALAHQRAEGGLVEAAWQEALAELDLEAKLGGLGLAALAGLLVVGERLLQRLRARPCRGSPS
jgi:hypothetical protein